MPDNFTIYEGVPAPVDGSEGKSKRLFNRGPDDLYFRSDPRVSSSDTKLQPGESTELTDRNWIVTDGQTEVIVTPASEEI
jgi:hypothetical protein